MLLPAVGHPLPLSKSPRFEMAPNPATKFKSDTDYFCPAALREREFCLTEYLERGPFNYDMLLTLLGLWNDNFTDGTCKHASHIAKPQAPAGMEPDNIALKKELASRVAIRLASWKWLNYAEASDETALGFLNLSLAAAGYLPRDSVEAALDLFANGAMGPVCTKDDLQDLVEGQERRSITPRVNFSYPKVDPRNYRQSPHLDEMVQKEKERLEFAREGFSALSTAEKTKVLADLNLTSIPSTGPITGVPPAEKPPGSSGSDVISMVSAVVTAMDLPNLLKQANKRKACSDSDSEDDDANRFARLTSFGSQELRKESRSKTLAEIKLDSELTRLRNTQMDRKVKTKCELSLQFNMAIDKETELLINIAEIEDEKDKAHSDDQLRMLKEVDSFTVNRLRGLQEELECIKSCLKLKSDGNHEMSGIKMKLFAEDKAGVKESKYMRDLDKRAMKQFKSDSETKLMQGFAAVSKMNLNNQRSSGGQPNQKHLQPPGPPPFAPTGKGGGGGKGAGKGKGKGKGNGGVRNFVLQFIDGSYFDPSLAGVMTPAPSAFPGFAPYLLDSSTGGIVHGPNDNWHGTCGNPNCYATGHGHTECKQARWSTNGVDHVNVRWLYQNGFCNNRGDRK